eukprot:jgi/Mesen1/2738/ME000169S01921
MCCDLLVVGRPEDVQSFLKSYFDEPGSDLEPHTPADFGSAPASFLPHVEGEARAWALAVHQIWLQLCRQVAASVESDPEKHSLIKLPNAMMIPGARFREVYYWDSYWGGRTSRGLLVSGMPDTASGIVYNLLSLATTAGFIPNGARSYYLNRSQPPLLSAMVSAVHAATGSTQLLRDAVPVLLQEHRFWTTAPHAVAVLDGDNCQHLLSRYYADWSKPRPESYAKDREAAEGLSAGDAACLFREIASAAESGWDFSSRWMEGVGLCAFVWTRSLHQLLSRLLFPLHLVVPGNDTTNNNNSNNINVARDRDGETLASLRTTAIIPVDLNAWLLQLESNLERFAGLLGTTDVAATFAGAAAARREALDRVLWCPHARQWHDLWLPLHCKGRASTGPPVRGIPRQGAALASNYTPLWIGRHLHIGCEQASSTTGTWSPQEAGDDRWQQVVQALIASGLVLPGGVATSLAPTGQQWDYPNAWAPLQHMIIEGVAASGTPQGAELARQLAARWLHTMAAGFVRTGGMHEKYDAREIGGVGGGGEYGPQAWHRSFLTPIPTLLLPTCAF